jgi:hypothetical protein
MEELKNIDSIKRYENFLKKLKEKLDIEKLFVPNFKKIRPKVITINENFSSINVGFTD